MPVFFRTEIHFLGTALRVARDRRVWAAVHRRVAALRAAVHRVVALRVAVLHAAVMVAATTVAAEMVISLDVDRLLDDFAVGDAGMA